LIPNVKIKCKKKIIGGVDLVKKNDHFFSFKKIIFHFDKFECIVKVLNTYQEIKKM